METMSTTNKTTIPYTHADALSDIEAARITLDMLTLDGGIFSYSREEAEKQLGTAYIMSKYEDVQMLLFNMACHLGRAYEVLQHCDD